MLDEIKSVARAIVDTKFAKAIPDRFDISEKAGLQSSQSLRNSLDRSAICEVGEPFLENAGLPNLDHLFLIGNKSSRVNYRRQT